jgi:hypothetical protein
MAVMIASRLGFVMIALAATVAHAQPGADGPPPPPDAPPPGAEVQVDAQARFDPGAMIDQLAVNAPMIERIAKGTFKRARRAISIGPTIGVYGGIFPDADQTDAAITFGLGVEMFKIPILPSMELIKEIAVKRAKERLRDALTANPNAGDAEQLARQIWDDVVKEVLGMENIRGRTMEKPKFSLGLEANRLLDAETWGVRLRGGIGISRVTLAASFSTLFADPDALVYVGPEIVAHFLLSKAPRASVVDVFVRADFEVANRGGAVSFDMYAAGVRFLLDAL